MTLSFSHARLSEARIRKLMRQVHKLSKVDDLEEPSGIPYGLVVGFYPRPIHEEREAPEKRTDR